VLGVVEDFHYQSLEQPIEPVLHFYGGPDGGAYRYLSVKLGRRDAAALLPLLHERWEAFDASRAFDYFFVDAFFAELYEEEENMARIVGYAALLALLIACLGLSGLASFAVVQRTKEIGVRKVLGASAGSIVALLARQLCKPIVLAFVLAMPAAYYLMHVWLQDFPYRIDVSPAVFVFAGGLALTVGLLTIGVQAVRAALANPVDTLRYE
jgi:putative ABC transport system permease protein